MIIKNSFSNNVKTNKRFQSVLKWVISAVLAFYIFYIPSMSYTSKLNVISYALLPLLGICSFFYIFIYKKFDLRKIKILIILFVIFCLFAFFSTALGAKQFASLPRLYLVLLSGFVLFASFYVFDKPENVLIIITCSMLSFVLFYFLYSLVFYKDRLIGWLTLTNDVPLTLQFFKRIGLDGGGGTNIISSYFGTCAILCLYFVLFKRRLYTLFIIPFILCLFAGITTASRQFIVGIFVCFVVFYFIAIHRKPILCIVSAAVIILAIVLFMVVPAFEPIRNPILEGLGLIDTTRGDKSASSRLLMQLEAFEIGGNRMFVGYGADGFEAVSGWGGYAHNTYANSYVSFGVFGTALYFSPMFITIKRIRKNNPKYFPLIIAFTVYYLVIALFIVWYKDKIFFIVYGLMIYFLSLKGEEIKTKPISYFEINI